MRAKPSSTPPRWSRTGSVQVVAVPYETSFDHQRITDDLQYKSDACLKSIAPEVRGLPVFGVGHSLGSLLTLMLNSRFAVHRDGNALISFNNRPATDVIPFLSPFLAPGTRALGPILSQARPHAFPLARLRPWCPSWMHLLATPPRCSGGPYTAGSKSRTLTANALCRWPQVRCAQPSTRLWTHCARCRRTP